MAAEQRIERRLTGDTVPVEAVYMTTIGEPHPEAGQGDVPEGLQRQWHYFRVPVPEPSRMGFV